jgi:hypothetical protein
MAQLDKGTGDAFVFVAPRQVELRHPPISRSAEGERKGLNAGIKKLNFELPIRNRTRLPDQLVHPQLGNCAFTSVVYINSVCAPWRASIDVQTKPRGTPRRCRPHHQMQIAGMKAVGDTPIWLVQQNGFFAHVPIAGKRP